MFDPSLELLKAERFLLVMVKQEDKGYCVRMSLEFSEIWPEYNSS